MFPEGELHAPGFAEVIEVGRGGVRVDVFDGFGRQVRVSEGALHGEGHAGSVLIGGRHVEGVAGSAVAHDLRIDFCSPRLSV